MINQWKRRKKGGSKFNPNHEFVQSAMDDYFNEGGKITRLQTLGGEVQGDREFVDEFLRGDHDNP